LQIFIGLSLNTNVYAIDPVLEPIAKLYVSIPLGQNKHHKRSTPRFGFQLDYTRTQPSENSIALHAVSKVSLLDLRYNHVGSPDMRIYGMNVTKHNYIYHANEDASTSESDINWGLLGIGVAIGVAGVVYKGTSDLKKPLITYDQDLRNPNKGSKHTGSGRHSFKYWRKLYPDCIKCLT